MEFRNQAADDAKPSCGRRTKPKWSRGESNPRAETVIPARLRNVVHHLISPPARGWTPSPLASLRKNSPLRAEAPRSDYPDVFPPPPYRASFGGGATSIRQREQTAVRQLKVCTLDNAGVCAATRNTETSLSGRYLSAPCFQRRPAVDPSQGRPMGTHQRGNSPRHRQVH